MNISNWLYETARVFPDKQAIFVGDECIQTYGEFYRTTQAIAYKLSHEYNIKAGDHVAIFMKNCKEYLQLMYAVWSVGGCVVPINAKLHASEVAWIADNASVRILFVDDIDVDASIGEYKDQSDFLTLCVANVLNFSSYDIEHFASPVKRNADDTAWIFYTSGTTGRPKGVELTHRNLIAMSLCYSTDVDEVLPDDAIYYGAPISHGAGLYNFIYVRKAAKHIFPVDSKFDPEEIISLAHSVKNINLFAAPTMVKRLIDSASNIGFKGEGIKTIVYGGGPMYNADIQSALALFGNRFVQIYGQGESPMTITALSRHWHTATEHPDYLKILSSVGCAQSVVEVKVFDSDFIELPPDVSGEICVRGDTVMKGYWNNPEATKNAIVGGWLKTGDIGQFDNNGFLTLTDRSKDVIISGGTNIYPREVEDILLMHSSVDEVSVIGEPDPDWGESVVAFIVGRDIDQVEIENWCLNKMARFKRPKYYHFVNELPKNNYGKVLKTELRSLNKKLKCNS